MGWTIIRLGYDPRYLTDLDPLFAEIAAVMAAELQAFALPLP
jgi:hypothetical protein